MKKRRNFLKSIIGISLFTGMPFLFSKSKAGNKTEKLFIHHVFFWLKDPESDSDRKKLEKALRLLSSIETINMSHIGIPADTDRDVIDNSYHYSLLLGFKNKRDHDIYQVHPIHDDFRNNYHELWEKVLVYDSVDI